MTTADAMPTFADLGLSPAILKAITEVGYERPSPIQAESIPVLLNGHDLLGQAQTGTGKTAAFALPLLSRMDPRAKGTQLLVLAPTRELAIQVAEAFQSYARFIKDFHVLPIYGGQSYEVQLRQLKRGVQVVVGTPGRVIDHIKRGTLKLDNLKSLVLDEADEMLRMGFIDDVEWVLEQTPSDRQIALFSATMPAVIRKVADKHLNQPRHILIKEKTTTAKTIHQRYWLVSGMHKLDAMTRILETENFDAILIFVRTKTATEELAEKLSARGYAAEAMHGDIQQKQRERIVDRLKKGNLDILIATDVVARGLDVERISHVINYDIPYNTEAYVHRIGRTGRAGRKGNAILFVAPRERRLLKDIENTTKQSIEAMQMPTAGDINQYRIARFKQRISDTLATADLDLFDRLVVEYMQEHDTDPMQIASALAHLLQGDEPLLLSEKDRKPAREFRDDDKPERRKDKKSAHDSKPARDSKPAPSHRAKPLKEFPEIPMQRFRLAVGYQHDVKPGNIVGAIANEADIESCYIGHIEIYDDYTIIDLPEGMPRELMQDLKRTRVCGQKLDITPISEHGGRESEPKPRKKAAKKGSRKTKAQKTAGKARKETRKKQRKRDRVNTGKPDRKKD